MLNKDPKDTKGLGILVEEGVQRASMLSVQRGWGRSVSAMGMRCIYHGMGDGEPRYNLNVSSVVEPIEDAGFSVASLERRVVR